MPFIQANYTDEDNYALMQDGAPCHTAKTVQAWQAENIKFWDKTMWPSSSPDLNPLDYSIWAFLQSKVGVSQYANLDNLKAAIRREWAGMSPGLHQEDLHQVIIIS